MVMAWLWPIFHEIRHSVGGENHRYRSPTLMNSTYAGLKLYASEFELKLKLSGWPWSKYKLLTNQSATHVVIWFKEPTKVWRNHPKRLGPGALIFIARQLGPNSARAGSSSSEASIKATLFQDRVDNTHTKVSPEITTQNISYISEWLQWKNKFITNWVQNSKVLQSSNYSNYSRVIVSTEVVKDV